MYTMSHQLDRDVDVTVPGRACNLLLSTVHFTPSVALASYPDCLTLIKLKFIGRCLFAGGGNLLSAVAYSPSPGQFPFALFAKGPTRTTRITWRRFPTERMMMVTGSSCQGARSPPCVCSCPEENHSPPPLPQNDHKN